MQHNSELFVNRREREREIAFLALQLAVGLGGGWELFCIESGIQKMAVKCRRFSTAVAEFVFVFRVFL